jgi:hypothetical protein
MGKDTGQIREEIEETRGEMGETVGALAYKTDVPSRVRDSVAEKRGRARSAMSGITERVRTQMASSRDTVSSATDRVGEATPDRESVKQGAQQAVGIAQENPLGLALGGVALGFLAGLAIPSTSVEDERLGPISDELKEKAKETGEEALERSKEVAQEAASAATDAAKESGQQQAEELRGSAQEKAQSVRDTAQQQT